jgi:hypothetical protein
MEKLSYKQTEANNRIQRLAQDVQHGRGMGAIARRYQSLPSRSDVPTWQIDSLISDEEMGNLFRQLDKIESEGLENYVIPLGIRLQFEFAGRRSEIHRAGMELG